MRPSTTKRIKVLVAYDYGQGAAWAYVLAESVADITRRFPELTIVAEPPAWWESRGMESLTPMYPVERLAEAWLGKA
jgi:hypothetical protein